MKWITLPLLTVIFTSLTIAQNDRYAFNNDSHIKLTGAFAGHNEFKPIVGVVKLDNGVKLEYTEQGNANGIPVVMLHGFPDSRRSYDLVFPLLPNTIHAYAISFRGFGESDKPENGYSPKDLADDVAAFLKARNIKKAIIVGHSMGATVAQQFAISHADKIAGLVLIGAIYTFEDKPMILELNEALKDLKDPIDTAFAVEFQQSTLYKEIPADYFTTLIHESMKIPARVWTKVVNHLVTSNTKEEIAGFKKPTLIMWGEKDVIAFRTDQEALKAAIENSSLIVYKEIGHDIQWEAPEIFTKDLIDFVVKVRF